MKTEEVDFDNTMGSAIITPSTLDHTPFNIRTSSIPIAQIILEEAERSREKKKEPCTENSPLLFINQMEITGLTYIPLEK